ncbi:hypothetical protein TWF694_006713 [Orbilia ellipsospora]|uniref:Uncharacterized protein n=1 Tax=Orbilia ellipsospora TaxID=2528407 RepID=A0AAV9XMB3_9PEZI
MSDKKQEKPDDWLSFLEGMGLPELDAAAATAVESEPVPQQQQGVLPLNPRAAEYVLIGPQDPHVFPQPLAGVPPQHHPQYSQYQHYQHYSQQQPSSAPLLQSQATPHQVQGYQGYYPAPLPPQNRQQYYPHRFPQSHLQASSHFQGQPFSHTQGQALYPYSYPAPPVGVFSVGPAPTFNYPPPHYIPPNLSHQQNQSVPWRNTLQHSPTSGTVIPAQNQQAQPAPLVHPKPSRSRPTILLSSPERAVEIADFGPQKPASLKKQVFSPEPPVTGPATGPAIETVVAESANLEERSSLSPLQLEQTPGSITISQQMSSQQDLAFASRRSSKRNGDLAMDPQGESSSAQMQLERHTSIQSLIPATYSLGTVSQTSEKPNIPMKKKAKTFKSKNTSRESFVLSQTTGNKAGPMQMSQSERGNPIAKGNTEGDIITAAGSSMILSSSMFAGLSAGTSNTPGITQEFSQTRDSVMQDVEPSQKSTSKPKKSFSAAQVDYLQRKYEEEARTLNPSQREELVTTLSSSSKLTVTSSQIDKSSQIITADPEILPDAQALKSSTKKTLSNLAKNSALKTTTGVSGTKFGEGSTTTVVTSATLVSSTVSGAARKSKAPGKIILPGPDPIFMQNPPIIEQPFAVKNPPKSPTPSNRSNAADKLQENQKPASKGAWNLSGERLSSLREFMLTDESHSATAELLERANAPYTKETILNEETVAGSSITKSRRKPKAMPNQKPVESSASLYEKAKKLRKLAEDLRKAKADGPARDALLKAEAAGKEATEREKLEKASKSQNALWDYIHEELKEPDEREFFNLATQLMAKSATKKEERKSKEKVTTTKKTTTTVARPSCTVFPNGPTSTNFDTSSLPSQGAEDWNALFNSYLGLAPGDSIATPEEARLSQEKIDREQREKESEKKEKGKRSEKGKEKVVTEVESVDTSSSINMWLGALEDPGNPEELGLNELEACFEEMWGTGGGGPPTVLAFAVGGEVEGEGVVNPAATSPLTPLRRESTPWMDLPPSIEALGDLTVPRTPMGRPPPPTTPRPSSSSLPTTRRVTRSQGSLMDFDTMSISSGLSAGSGRSEGRRGTRSLNTSFIARNHDIRGGFGEGEGEGAGEDDVEML